MLWLVALCYYRKCFLTLLKWAFSVSDWQPLSIAWQNTQESYFKGACWRTTPKFSTLSTIIKTSTEYGAYETGVNKHRNGAEWTGMRWNRPEWHRNGPEWTGMTPEWTGISFFCKKWLLLVNVLICVPKLKVFKSIFSYACFIIICCWSGGLIRFATISSVYFTVTNTPSPPLSENYVIIYVPP